MKLHAFFRSGTSHRLRIALNLKGLSYEVVPVDLRRDEHLGAAYKAINPQGLVPALDVEGRILTQSPAMLEWLEERHPHPPLLPADADDRQLVRALAAIIGCDIHPINNRRVLEYLRKSLGCDERAIQDWVGTWIRAGFDALEPQLARLASLGDYAFGSSPGLVDVYLIPQVAGARRFEIDLAAYPRILAIDAACAELDAFARAAPSAQPDAPGR